MGQAFDARGGGILEKSGESGLAGKFLFLTVGIVHYSGAEQQQEVAARVLREDLVFEGDCVCEVY